MADTAPPTTYATTLALYLLTPLALSAAIFALHGASVTQPYPMLPPGWAVGFIWVLLFFAMGTARWLARLISPSAAHWIDTLAILCLLYPLYTTGIRNDRVGLAGAIITAAYAAFAIFGLQRVSKIAAILTSLVLVWLLYASAALAFGLHSGYHG